MCFRSYTIPTLFLMYFLLRSNLLSLYAGVLFSDPSYWFLNIMCFEVLEVLVFPEVIL